MNIGERERRLMLYAGGILALVLVYMFLFRPAKEKCRMLEQENLQLSVQAAQLERLDGEREQYRGESAAMKDGIEELLSRFPADVRAEDAIVYADLLEQSSDLKITGIGVDAKTALNTDAGVEGSDYTLYGTKVTYTFTAAYQGLKQMIELLQREEDRKSVESVSLSFDPSTGKIVGNMQVYLYSINGAGKEYEEPDVQTMPLGTDNIFGTVTFFEDAQSDVWEEREGEQEMAGNEQ